jgi:hypothetical protein
MRTALMENSRPMEGRAILMEDPMKGVRKDAVVVTNSMTFLFTSTAFPMTYEGKRK